MAEMPNKELKNALAQIEKEFGKGAIMSLNEGALQEIQGISTGAVSLDLALGGKGLPRGRIIEIYGPESSGKTTVALHAIANAQRPAASPPSSTPSTPSTRPGPSGSASISRNCSSASRPAAKRR